MTTHAVATTTAGATSAITCTCGYETGTWTYPGAVAHLFNAHVMLAGQQQTLDEALATFELVDAA